MDWCKSPDVGLPRPDLVLYMTLAEEKLALRDGFGDEIYESLDFQAKVKFNYQFLIEDNWTTIPADDTIEALHEKLLKLTKETVSRSKNNPLELLWTKSP